MKIKNSSTTLLRGLRIPWGAQPEDKQNILSMAHRSNYIPIKRSALQTPFCDEKEIEARITASGSHKMRYCPSIDQELAPGWAIVPETLVRRPSLGGHFRCDSRNPTRCCSPRKEQSLWIA